ncbi:hypothetical protein BJ508DRAFT_374635 [Ascobolus immersus RN42]|uniref:Uncharacterized protein n=1 Tax=Ascobolus immersus RN42 TaxID=1160509 RepID=A0A3N4IE34_ASCIM|nr:hypothetical protein BJ508DRAFT_374635 [Ascobolus immersus RN42]
MGKWVRRPTLPGIVHSLAITHGIALLFTIVITGMTIDRFVRLEQDANDLSGSLIIIFYSINIARLKKTVPLPPTTLPRPPASPAPPPANSLSSLPPQIILTTASIPPSLSSTTAPPTDPAAVCLLQTPPSSTTPAKTDQQTHPDRLPAAAEWRFLGTLRYVATADTVFALLSLVSLVVGIQALVREEIKKNKAGPSESRKVWDEVGEKVVLVLTFFSLIEDSQSTYVSRSESGVGYAQA